MDDHLAGEIATLQGADVEPLTGDRRLGPAPARVELRDHSSPAVVEVLPGAPEQALTASRDVSKAAVVTGPRALVT